MEMLYRTVAGTYFGKIIGLKNSDEISSFFINGGEKQIQVPGYYNASNKNAYYAGFGIGYEQGQKLRNFLEFFRK